MTEQEKDERYMRLALDEARKAFAEGEIPIGCVVVCKDRVVARTHNLTETLCDCTLYVTVEPCPMCAGALGWAQVLRIVYGCQDEKRGYRLYAPRALHPKANITGGTLEEECRQLMQDFFQQRR